VLDIQLLPQKEFDTLPLYSHDYALEIRDRAASETVLVTAYNDCTPVYVPDPVAFEEGGYEIGPWCYSMPTTGRALVEAAVGLIKQSRR
jgi:hypothetical protein